METYRIINRELSINNQELRNVINKLKHEVTYLNRQLLEQREEFYRLKASIVKTIEQKYIETIALIIPDKSSDQKQQGKLDIASHRRSCSNVTAADPIKNRSHSPPAGSSSCASDVLDESTFKLPIPRIVVEGSGRLSKSPGKCPQSIANQSQSRKSEDLQISKSRTEDLNSSESSELGQTLKTSNTSLITINEEKSCGPDAANETLSDATINCLLDAPCSTPYNHHKVPNETTFQQKRLRVLVKRMSEEKLSQLSTQNSHCSRLSASRLKNTLFTSKSAQIEACHSEMTCSQLSASHFKTTNNSTCEYNINSSSDGESFAAAPKTMPNKIQTKEKIIRLKDKSIKKPSKKERLKGKLNKENCGTDSDFTCSDEETTGGRRLRHKQLSLKEPSLRVKLRNTTNIKLK